MSGFIPQKQRLAVEHSGSWEGEAPAEPRSPLTELCMSSYEVESPTFAVRREPHPPVERNARRWSQPFKIALLFACWLGLPQSLPAAGRVFPVQEFEEVRDRWIGLETTVEGRRQAYDETLIKLKNSSVIFKPTGKLPKLERRGGNLRLTGTLEKIDSRFVFQVRTIEEVPGDFDQYLAREREIKRTDHAQWYALAEWVEGRGKFYNDSALLEKAQECKRKGFDIERRQLPDGDHRARMELAARSSPLGIAETVRQELVHEAFVLRRKVILEKFEPAAEDQLLTDMEQDLAGATQTLKPDDPALRQRYLLDPVTVYAETKPLERPALHRLLWSSLTLPRLERQLAADFHNGFEIAEKIDEQLPEFHSKAETYRDKVLELRALNVDKMTRSELLKLRKDYVDRQQAQSGDIAVEAWLRAKQKRLAADDIEGLLSLADQYEELLKQPQTRLRLIRQAAELHPESPELIERMTQLKFRRHDEKWITDAEFRAIPQGRLEQALQDGRVEIGMTARQVQRSLGVPATTTRVVARGIVNEIWSYQSPGSAQPLMIYLIRRLPATECTVVGVDKLP